MSTCHRRITERRSSSLSLRVFVAWVSFSTPTLRLVPPAYTSSACAPAKPNDDDAMEPWFRVDTSLLVTYQTHTRALYSTLASGTTVVQSLVERVVVRASPRSLPRASHNTQRTRTQRDDVSTRGARTRPSANARTRERQIDSDTQHNTHTTRRSVVHRLVVGLIPIRTIG